MNKEYRRGKHSVTSLKSHLVFVTKYRKKMFDAQRLEVLIQSFFEVAKKMDFSILEVNGEGDQVHLLVEYPPKYSISQLVNTSKVYPQDFIASSLQTPPTQNIFGVLRILLVLWEERRLKC